MVKYMPLSLRVAKPTIRAKQKPTIPPMKITAGSGNNAASRSNRRAEADMPHPKKAADASDM